MVHAGLRGGEDETPFLPGPTFAAPYHLRGDPAARTYGYGRYANPTWSAYEQALGELEEGDVLTFASGMAAVSAALLPALTAGDVLVLPHDGYPGVRNLARGPLASAGVERREIPSTLEAFLAALPGATGVWVETPTNPRLDVIDVARIVEAAREHGAWVAVDNTLATPLRQRPLALGADLSVASASKHLTGHSDLVLGYVATRDPDRLAALTRWRGDTGGIPGPMETWLAHRSLATLDVRLGRQEENAAAIAAALRGRDDVLEVLTGGTLVSFTVESAARAEALLGACELVAEATSFGGVHTSAERRGRWNTDDVADGFIRLSAGIEDAADLVADLAAALDATA